MIWSAAVFLDFLLSTSAISLNLVGLVDGFAPPFLNCVYSPPSKWGPLGFSISPPYLGGLGSSYLLAHFFIFLPGLVSLEENQVPLIRAIGQEFIFSLEPHPPAVSSEI